MYSCYNRKGNGIFANYQAFWIIVVIAIVIIWVHYGVGCNRCNSYNICDNECNPCDPCGNNCGCASCC